MTTDAEIYTQAMKLDMMMILEEPELRVFEIRKIQAIAKAMVDFLNSLDTFQEREGWGTVLAETEGKAPVLHAALRDRTFDGESAFKDLYVQMLEKYVQMRDAQVEYEYMHRRIDAGERRVAIAEHLKLPPLPPTLETIRTRELGAGGPIADVLETGDEEPGDIDGDEQKD